MGVGMSSDSVQIGRPSAILISRTPIVHQSPPTATLRRPSQPTGIAAHLPMPVQFYPNNVYHTNGVSSSQAPPTARNHLVSSAPPSDDFPPPYTSIYPSVNSSQ